MLIYLRKFTENDTKKQIEATAEIYANFFGGDLKNYSGISFSIKNLNTGDNGYFKLSKAAGVANSYRYSSTDGKMSFSSFINNGLIDKYRSNDILKIDKIKNNYFVTIIKQNCKEYETLNNLFINKQEIIMMFENNNEKEYDVFGIHITNQNTALKDNHICIGWSSLGDLTNINTLEELRTLYITKNPYYSNKQIIANIRQIWLFKQEIKIGDYIVFFDKGLAHIGKVIGDYEFINNVDNQDEDYVNNRKVEWIKKDIPYQNIPAEFRRSAKTRCSLFKLESYKPLISDILNGKELIKDDSDILEDDILPLFDFNLTDIKIGENLIIYGTPGCGKSYYLQNTLLNDYSSENIIRTTFFQDYTNTDFVGQILPIVDGEKVSYKFIPGPFTLALEQAIKKPNEKVALVIEELNRGNAPSIFGDIFQLLDRKNGVSEYPIINVNIIDYLNEKFNDIYTFDIIRLPGNFSIFATMNTSDQNVFTLDTAFKRRWKFKKISNKFTNEHRFKNKYIPTPPDPKGEVGYTWEQLVNGINEYILEISDGLNSEDKQIGVYFVDEKGMKEKITDVSTPEDIEAFAYKLLEYLWDDVAKFQRNEWFKNDIKSLDQLIDNYIKYGIEVFNDEVFKKKK